MLKEKECRKACKIFLHLRKNLPFGSELNLRLVTIPGTSLRGNEKLIQFAIFRAEDFSGLRYERGLSGNDIGSEETARELALSIIDEWNEIGFKRERK